VRHGAHFFSFKIQGKDTQTKENRTFFLEKSAVFVLTILHPTQNGSLGQSFPFLFLVIFGRISWPWRVMWQ